MRFDIGRAVHPDEAGVVTELAAQFRTQSYDARELLLDFIASDRFALRREEPPE